MLGDRLVCGILVEPSLHKKGFAYAVSANGHAKRIAIEDFPVQGRGGQGVQLWKINEDTGLISGFAVGYDKDNVDIYSSKAKRLRLDGKALPLVTRATKGLDLGKKYTKGDLFGEGESTAGLVVS